MGIICVCVCVWYSVHTYIEELLGDVYVHAHAQYCIVRAYNPTLDDSSEYRSIEVCT